MNFGTRDDQKITLHYQSEVPTDFRPSDGVPEAFLCDLCPNPGSVEINSRDDMDQGSGIGLFDSTGEISGFPDVSNYGAVTTISLQISVGQVVLLDAQ